MVEIRKTKDNIESNIQIKCKLKLFSLFIGYMSPLSSIFFCYCFNKAAWIYSEYHTFIKSLRLPLIIIVIISGNRYSKIQFWIKNQVALLLKSGKSTFPLVCHLSTLMIWLPPVSVLLIQLFKLELLVWWWAFVDNTK